MPLATRVLEVRRAKGRIEDAIVDARIADLPLANNSSASDLATDACWRLATVSAAVVSKSMVGSAWRTICIGSNLALPEAVVVGDILLAGDAGGYNRSMAYEFGRGR